MDSAKNLAQASTLMNSGEYRVALEELDDLLRDEPNNAKALDYAGVCCFELDELDSAISFYNMAIESAPKDSFAYAEKAKCLFMKRDFSGALKNFEMAQKFAKKKVKKAEFLVAEGYVELVVGKQEKGSELFMKAYGMDPIETVRMLERIFDGIYRDELMEGELHEMENFFNKLKKMNKRKR